MAAGIAIGFRLPQLWPAIPVPAWSVLLVAYAFLSRRRSDCREIACGRASRTVIATTLLASLLSGYLLGSASAARVGASCVLDLRSGEAVVAVGTTAEAANPGRSRRLSLAGVTLRRVSGTRACRLPRLVSRVDAVTQPLQAGSGVAVRGEWVKLGRPTAWPRRPGRHGMVVGQVEYVDPAGSTVPGPHPWSPIRVLRGLRVAASDRLRGLLPPDVDPIARALVLAERDDLPGRLRTRFAEAGLAHMLAISGLHVGLIGTGVALLLRSFAGRSFAVLGSALIVAAYVTAIGAPPSAVRASVLLAGWAASSVRGLPARAWDLLGVAAMISLVADPLVLGEPGFQLSFAGFAGLGAGAAAWRSLRTRQERKAAPVTTCVGRLPRPVRRRLDLLGLAMTSGAGAFTATAPIVALHFQHLAPSALFSHFVATPLVGAAIGSLAMALLLPPPFDGLGASAATTVIRFMVLLADRIAGLPGAHAPTSAPSALLWVSLTLGLVALWRFLRWGRVRSAILPASAAAALLLAAPALHRRVANDRSLICTLDVGQGDAAALRTADGRWILFDSGPRIGRRDAGRDVILPFLRRYGARRVDLFVLSHPDLDHVGGFDAVHASVPVFRVLDSGHPLPKPSYARFLARAEADGIRWLSARKGDAVRLDNVTIRVLGPTKRPVAEPDGPANETSLMLRISIGRALVYLSTGDATASDERKLLSAWDVDSLRADLLKVGHHGSRTSTSSAFLAAVRPSLAVISAGRGNAYGHPHETVLDRLSQASGTRLWRTDRDGTLCVEVDDERGWRIQGERTWHPGGQLARVLTSQRGDE